MKLSTVEGRQYRPILWPKIVQTHYNHLMHERHRYCITADCITSGPIDNFRLSLGSANSLVSFKITRMCSVLSVDEDRLYIIYIYLSHQTQISFVLLEDIRVCNKAFVIVLVFRMLFERDILFPTTTFWHLC